MREKEKKKAGSVQKKKMLTHEMTLEASKLQGVLKHFQVYEIWCYTMTIVF